MEKEEKTKPEEDILGGDPLKDALENLKKEREEERADKQASHHDSMIDRQVKHAASSSPVIGFLRKIRVWLETGNNVWIAFGGIVAAFVLLLIVPTTRFSILNAFGVKATVEVHVVDEGTGLPLKHVAVRVDTVEKLTDNEGKAILANVRLGSQVVEIAKLAYASEEFSHTVTTGNNSINTVELRPTGSQYQFSIKALLSEEPIEGAEVLYSENSVFSNNLGVALLTVPPVNEKTMTITVVAAGYEPQRFDINASVKAETEVTLIPDTNHFFISKRDGTYDLYKIKVDGSGEELVLSGTGKESRVPQILVDTQNRAVYLVSSREGNRNQEGSILQGLYKIDSETSELEKLDESESIRLYGISDDRLVYVKVAAGQSGGSPERNQLVSYNPLSGDSLTIYKSNYFNSVVVTDSAIFFAPSDLYKTQEKPYLFRASPSNTALTTMHAEEVWTIFRTGLDELTFDAQQDWYKVSTAAGSKPVPLDGRPADLSTVIYEISPNGSKALWVDDRDGKGHLIITDTQSREDVTVAVQSGLRYPVKWLDDNYVTYRVVTSSETADYVVDIRGGEPQKIKDVSDAPSIERWYYYY